MMNADDRAWWIWLIGLDDLKKIVADSITAQLPTVIIEASKVARENLTLDKDELAKALTAEVKKLKQSHKNLTLVSEAATLKSDGMLFGLSDL